MIGCVHTMQRSPPAGLAQKRKPALQAAKIPDFRFHDLRHTFASRLAMEGVDLYTIQRAGGWKTQVMVQRYAHLNPGHIRAAVERLTQATPRDATGTRTGTDETPAPRGSVEVTEKNGAPGGNRTPDPRLRRPMLYPTELRARQGLRDIGDESTPPCADHVLSDVTDMAAKRRKREAGDEERWP